MRFGQRCLEGAKQMVVGETLELLFVFIMVFVSIILVVYIQKITGGVDEEE